MPRRLSPFTHCTLFISTAALALSAAALDVDSLWDFRNPSLSEQRFRTELAGASGDDALILQTQIARTHGLRRDFAKAQEVLRSIEPQLATAGAEARVRHALEWGRALASATHPAHTQTTESKQSARKAFLNAAQLAKDAHLDVLAIDALHMMAFVDTAPEDQLKWGREALAVVLASKQPAALRWEASLRNNIGYALHQLGRYPEALGEFERAVVLREAGSNPQATRVARWMVAWTYRALGRVDDALELQLRLERENDAAATPDRYVFEELEALYRSKGDAERAEHYAQRRKAEAR